MSSLCPVLCVVAGPNGSGKTSTTEKLLANEWAADSFYINPDNIAQNKYGDWNSQEAVLKAAQEATRQRYQCLEERKSFVFETVFSSHEKLDFLRKASLYSIFSPTDATDVTDITMRLHAMPQTSGRLLRGSIPQIFLRHISFFLNIIWI